MIKLYDFLPSGNCYKVRLLLAHLGLEYDRVNVDRLGGETRTAAFLAKNPNGKVPLLELENGERLPESNAILFYLAEGTKYVPAQALAKARTLQWLFFEQHSHMPHVALPRFWILFLKKEEEFKTQIAEKHVLGYQALDVMEDQLKKTPFLTGQTYTIADISLFAYTHVAEVGKFDLKRYPAILKWLALVKTQPGFIPLKY